jgi:tRNA nucleotidyltransferase (CCA-adding enzyme)
MSRTRADKGLTVVTGHANADFDCLSAMIAAGKLYPEAVLVFPGSQEKTLRNFFIQSATFLFNFTAAKEVDPAAVTRLVVVDTRQRSRLPHVQAILDKPGIDIHLYDHHPDSADDLTGSFSLVKPWGSCAALIAGELRDRGLSVSPEEATVIGLGIYEDTGSFTFNSTTADDLLAAAWLRAKGMDLEVISDLLTRDLTTEQVAILNALLQSATSHEINGVEIVMAEATSEDYVGDFALLAHKMMDMENIRVLFALGRMQDRVVLVARSRAPEVDVGRICEFFGGGGHAFAASASVKDKTLNQVKDELFALLYSSINPQLTVDRFMSKSPVVIEKNRTLAEATEIMTRYGLKAMPVVDVPGRTCVGLIEHQIADKAVAHGLGAVEVREYMLRDIRTVTPADGLYTAVDIILGMRQRLVPVVEGAKLVGVITRTDLINILVEEPARIPEHLLPDRKRERSIARLLSDRLPPRIVNLLKTAGELAQEHDFEAYVVGGFVRDILLGRQNFDVDLVVEGDGIAFAGLLAEKLGGRRKAHKKFQTAVVVLPDDSRIDVATARLEYYEYPAALPTVELSSIKMDLYRRDFTINALAVHLNPRKFGHLVDFFGAQRDLKDRIIRVLHSLSFVEDPTRILRAVRFESRFNFRIGAQTERLIKNAVQMNFFQQLSGSRIFHELRLIFEEKNVLKCLERMQQFKLLGHLHPRLTLDVRQTQLVDKIEAVLDWYRLLYIEPAPAPWKLYLLALTIGFEEADVEALTQRLSFIRKDSRDFLALRRTVAETFARVLIWQNAQGPMSELCFILEKVPLEGLLYLMARSTKEAMSRNISLYLTRLKGMSPDIDGRDLQRLGLTPGPTYAKVLRRVLAAKIDGKADCREEQLLLAERLVKPLVGLVPEPKRRGPGRGP